jgi:hypothetical protein
MTLEGTVVNGVIVLDGGVQLPEGERVRVEVADPDDLAPPPEPYDREKELAILRESIEDMKAGRTIPARQALADIARKYGLPLEPGE